jgi:aspartyl-tRNA(Asn)/glutamyl-tRNA(Gln) amidotransferase subunit B
LHLEQDAGKSLHDQDPNLTFVDLNRSGIALMEIVSNPDMSSADEAVEYVKKVRSILRYLDTCDGNMEQGSLRADVNVSVNKPGDELGTRCEIKNLNSFKYIYSAIIYEAKRQVKLIESGESINQETRLYNIDTGETRSMRSKEDAHDYRYFPDPDLLPLEIEDKWIEEIKSTIPELPDQKKNRFIKDYNLNEYDAGVIVSDKATSDYYEKVVKNRSPKLVTTWVTSELFSILNKKNLTIDESPVSHGKLGELIDNIESGKVSNRLAKDIFEEMCETGKSPRDIISEKGLSQISDEGEIEKLINDVLSANPENVEKYKNGKDKLFGFFVGEAMKLSKGKANPKLLNELLKSKLNT